MNIDFTPLIPPLLATIGGFIAILYGSFPMEVDKNLRPLVASIFVVLIWTSFVFTVIAGEEITLFSPYITLSCLALGLLALAVLFFYSIGNQPQRIARGFFLYLLAVFLIISGFTNYLTTKDKIIILIPKTSRCNNLKSATWSENSEKYGLLFQENYLTYGVVWPEERFSRLTEIELIWPEGSDCPNNCSKSDMMVTARGLSHAHICDFF